MIKRRQNCSLELKEKKKKKKDRLIKQWNWLQNFFILNLEINFIFFQNSSLEKSHINENIVPTK